MKPTTIKEVHELDKRLISGAPYCLCGKCAYWQLVIPAREIVIKTALTKTSHFADKTVYRLCDDCGAMYLKAFESTDELTGITLKLEPLEN